MSSIRERVTRYYQAHAPENISNVDNALQRYKGKEDQLIPDLIRKYGKPEPSSNSTSSNTATPSSPAAGNVLGLIDDSSDGNRLTTTTSFSPAPAASNNSYNTTSHPSMLVSSPSMRQQSFVAPVYDSDGEDSDLPPLPSDPYDELRSKVLQDTGFADPSLKRTWEDAWLGSIPLQNCRKMWGDTVILAGMGVKLTIRSKPVQRWQKRYFVLVPHFLYYFDTDDSMSPCKGAVYLDKAQIKEEEVREKRSIVIHSKVYKKPLEIVHDGDFSAFTVSFEPRKVQDSWMDMLIRVSKIEGKVQGTQQGGGATTVSGSTTPPMSPMKSSKSMRRGNSPNTSSLRRGTSMANVASPTARLRLEQPAPVVPSTTTESFLLTPQSQLGTLPTAVPQFQPPQQPQGDATSTLTELQRLQLLQQQQQLHEMLLSTQHQHNDLLYRAQLQQEHTKAKSSLHIDEADMKKRITKIAGDREVKDVGEVLLQFVCDNVSDLNALWKLMSALDDLPRRSQTPPPAIAPLPLPSQAQLQHQDTMQSALLAAQLAANQSAAAMVSRQQQQVLSPQKLGGQSGGYYTDEAEIASRIAVAQAERRHEEQESQRRRIQQNYEIAQQLASPKPSSSLGLADNQWAPHQEQRQQQRRVSPAPSPGAAGPYGAEQHPTMYYDGGATTLLHDSQWQERMMRMKQRKRVVEGILNDLPGSV